MTRKERIGIIGGGGWGIALANHLISMGPVTLWEFFPDAVERLRKDRHRPEVLPGVLLDERILVTGDPEEASRDLSLALFVVPSHVLRQVAQSFLPHILPHLPIVSATKGLEIYTQLRMSQVLGQVLGNSHSLAVISGPSHAEEVAHHLPTTLVVASKDKKLADTLQRRLLSPHLRVYTSTDVVGVELGGSLKNIIAIAAGMCSTLGYGDNAMGALITRGLAEIARLGVALGAKPITFMGLSGLGDLITTCISQFSRNRILGERIGHGEKLSDILASTATVAEGASTVKAAKQLGMRLGVDLPITDAVWGVLYGCLSPKKAAQDLMTRQPKSEDEI